MDATSRDHGRRQNGSVVRSNQRTSLSQQGRCEMEEEGILWQAEQGIIKLPYSFIFFYERKLSYVTGAFLT